MNDLESISGYLTSTLSKLASDLDYAGEIDGDTCLFADLGFESLDLVVLGTAIQEYYGRKMAFTELMADLGERQIKDLTLSELTDFVHSELAKQG